MFSETTRYHYEKNQLLDVICQIRFPAILSIDTQEPAGFQELIREEFPQFMARKEPAVPRTVKNGGANGADHLQELVNYYFIDADDGWRVNLTRQFVALTCSRYDCWELFAKKLDKILAAFISVYHPAYFERIGLRYLNAFSRKALDLEAFDWRDLVQPAYLGFLAQEDVLERTTTQCLQNLETGLAGGCRLKLHCGPGQLQRKGQTDKEVRYILDLDVSMSGKVPVNQVAPALSTVHAQANTIFENALQPTLRTALQPVAMQ